MNDAKTALSSNVPDSGVHREMNMYARARSPPVFARLLRLGKPRVVSLIVFAAVTSMFLATPGLPPAKRLRICISCQAKPANRHSRNTPARMLAPSGTTTARR
jgi:hypothetical protein